MPVAASTGGAGRKKSPACDPDSVESMCIYLIDWIPPTVMTQCSESSQGKWRATRIPGKNVNNDSLLI